jgi:predicted TIM-barrel fold metal-dependent hydrolase
MKALAADYSPVIDCHAHVGPVWPDQYMELTVADSIHLMDLCGIDKVCSSASRAIRFDFREGNRVIKDAMDQFPDRIIGFAVADPLRTESSIAELDRCLGEEGFKGIKIHISHSDVPYDHSSYDCIYAKAVEYKVPVLAHTFSSDEVRQFTSAAKRFPEADFIVGHSGGYRWPYLMDMIAETPNAYFDLCCSCQDRGRVEAFVRAGGVDRVLFGTDLPFLHPGLDLSQVIHAEISVADKQKILGTNMGRILGMD